MGWNLYDRPIWSKFVKNHIYMSRSMSMNKFQSWYLILVCLRCTAWHLSTRPTFVDSWNWGQDLRWPHPASESSRIFADKLDDILLKLDLFLAILRCIQHLNYFKINLCTFICIKYQFMSHHMKNMDFWVKCPIHPAIAMDDM